MKHVHVITTSSLVATVMRIYVSTGSPTLTAMAQVWQCYWQSGSPTLIVTAHVVAFSLPERIWGEDVRPFIPCLRFFFFFFKVEISSRTLIPLFRPGSVHSGYAPLDDCGRVFPDKLRVNLFPDRFPRCAWTAA